MRRSGLLVATVFLAGGLAGRLVSMPAGSAADPPRADRAPATGPEAGIKAATAEYVKAFNAGDAKAAAELWTATGEYVGSDGEVITGREEIEKDLAAFFKDNPKTKVEVKVESVRPMGRGLATAEGVVTVTKPGAEEPVLSRYTALHFLEDGQWRAASVKEWVPDPATDATVKNMEWLVGEWTAKGEAGDEVKIVYEWDEDKVFLNGRYSVTKDSKTLSKGRQVIGRNPTGGLRSWMFDSTGTTSDAIWTRDGKRWVSEATGVTPDGTEVTSVNVVVPLGPDAYTWQTVERAVNGTPASPLPPVKVSRVKK